MAELDFVCGIARRLEERVSFAQAVDNALAETESLSEGAFDIPQGYEDDSEEWLEVSPDELDGLLSKAEEKQKSGLKMEGASVKSLETDGMDVEEVEANQQASNLSELAKKVGRFVEAQGDLDGARFEE